MFKLGFFKSMVVLLGAILEISATTHWYVTENGKIQPQHDTEFDMHHPYDLIALLEQEKKVEIAKAFYEEMLIKKTAIANYWSNVNSVYSSTDAEQKIHSMDCLWTLPNINFHASIAVDGNPKDGFKPDDCMLKVIPPTGKYRVPNCEKIFPLDCTFEYLRAVQNRKNLTQHEEMELTRFLPLYTDLNKFGHQLAHCLIHNKTSWVYLNLAATYWRIKGNAYNALECSLRALVSAPRQYVDIPLLTTSGILHAAKHYGEAAVVLRMATDYNPTQSYYHFALGHVYAILGDFERSIAYYDYSLKLTPQSNEVIRAKDIVLCLQQIEKPLISLYQLLEDTLLDLHTHYRLQKELFKLYERMLWERATAPEVKIPVVEKRDLQDILNNLDEACHHLIEAGSVLFRNTMKDYVVLTKHSQLDINIRLELLKSVQSQVKQINKYMIGSTHFQKDIASVFLILMEPYKQKFGFNLKIAKRPPDFEFHDWPQSSDCDGLTSLLTDTKKYMATYLSPETKGFATHLFVNEYINLKLDEKHPLPWHPPICELSESFNDKYISDTLLMAVRDQTPPDSTLKNILELLVKNADIAEIGQRILTAIKLDVTAPWVLYMLASLHWRVVGKFRNALDCLQLALNTIPQRFKDVPLVSVASIYHKVGLVDDALRLTKEALDVNCAEPVTNYLFGTLLHLKGNYTGAIHYLKQALRADIHLYDGRALTLLRTLACHIKFGTVP